MYAMRHLYTYFSYSVNHNLDTRDREQQRGPSPVRATQHTALWSLQPHLVAGTDSSDKKPKENLCEKTTARGEGV